MRQAAYQVFAARPVTGVGPGNSGAYAANNFDVGDVTGQYAEDPGTLYGRALHNRYVQVLSENGLIGVALFLTVVVDFWRRNAQLREPQRLRFWAASTGGTTDLRFLSPGLESAMVAYLATALFYDQLYMHWFFRHGGGQHVTARGDVATGQRRKNHRPARRPMTGRTTARALASIVVVIPMAAGAPTGWLRSGRSVA